MHVSLCLKQDSRSHNLLEIYAQWDLQHERAGAISKKKFILFHLFHLIPYLNLLFWG